MRTFREEYRPQFEETTTEFHHVTTGKDGSAALFRNARGGTSGGGSLGHAGATLPVFDEEGPAERFRKGRPGPNRWRPVTERPPSGAGFR